MLLKDEIAIFILSCDKFSVTWKPCIDHFFNAWPECPFSVYLLNNFQSAEDYRVKDLLVGEDCNWSDTLKKGLTKVTENRVFFLFDDSFITKFNLDEINSVFKRAIENDLDSVSIRRKRFDNGIKSDQLLYLINPTAKYRNSLFLNLMRKDLLLKLLKSGESAWQFEKEGNIRNKNHKFYSVYKNDLCIYHHGIVKGKWLPETYNYLLASGYCIDDNSFEVHTAIRMVIMKAYNFAWYFAQKFLHYIRQNMFNKSGC